MAQLDKDFWNFRGDFRLGGLINIGTHMSLARLGSGRFVLLDSYALKGTRLQQLNDLTDGGKAIEAILNVHPFHTVHCEAVAGQFPEARMIGTRRHQEQCPDVRWDDNFIEDAATWKKFDKDLDFSIPAGVDFISDNDKIHVSSVLVRHRSSRIVHVDDTLNVLALPALLKPMLPRSRLHFHMMLSKALKKYPAAADEYAAWAEQLATEWADTRIVCTAHSAVHRLESSTFSGELLDALKDAKATLERHRRKYRSGS